MDDNNEGTEGAIKLFAAKQNITEEPKTKLNATGYHGRQMETTETTGENGRQRETTGDNGPLSPVWKRILQAIGVLSFGDGEGLGLSKAVAQ